MLAIKISTVAQPAVRKVVIALREDSLGVQPGTLLGQEDDLIARYGVSRPTLRQAAALVGQEQLVKVRRGVGGGYFAERPNFSSVAHMASILLKVRGTRREDMLHAVETIRSEMIVLAAERITPSEAAGLEELLEQDEVVLDVDYSFRRFLRAERQHNEIVGEASGNNVLHLFMQILLDLVATLRPEDDMLFGKEERYLAWRAQRNKMLRAILSRDSEIASIEARRCAQMIRRWTDEDQASGAPQENAAWT